MIRSMTAYAGGERVTPWGTLGCEMRSVNHRFLEVGVRLPEELRALEPQLRERVAGRISRGKLDLVMRLRVPEAAASLNVNEALVEQLGDLVLRLHSRFPGMRIGFTDLLQYPGVLRADSTDAVALQAEAMALLDEVIDGFVLSREREGDKLATAISERVDSIERIAADVRELIPVIRDGQRAKLAARLADLPHPVDPGRAEQELVMWLQKLDVDEELDRLSSHIGEIRRVLKQREPVGRRLDFLLQEFNRESNTLGSKSVDSRTSNASVELKVLIDQIREQVQNIE
ncbi:MAG: YicC/YloC family endoribonuclease [Stenotrophomonas sp.]|uniref:YicC/YloC family endoribonuclease n=1 Tax=Stenotrophomonas sp. TaxID=69392 RepID=UPI003D6CA01B